MKGVDRVDEALERLVPRFDHELPYWEDVLVRAHDHGSRAMEGESEGNSLRRTRRLAPDGFRGGLLGRRPVRPLAIVLAVIVAVVLAGTALALERYVFVGDPAPPAVKEGFSRLNQPPRGLLLPRPRLRPPAVLGERARAAAVLNSSVGPIYLWVAPTEDGGACYRIQILAAGPGPDGRARGGGGGCNRGQAEGLLAGVTGSRTADGRFVWLANGQVPPTATRVQLRFLDGRLRDVPVRDQFFLAEVPPGQVGSQDQPERPRLTLVALDAQGDVVGRQAFTHPPPPRLDFDVSNRRPLIEIRTRRTKRPLRLYVFDQLGQPCSVVENPGAWKSGGCSGSPKANEIRVTPQQIGAADDPRAMLVLSGQAGKTIATLELRFNDGPAERLPLTDGWTLYQVDPADLAAGRVPTELVGRDTDGKIVATSEVSG